MAPESAAPGSRPLSEELGFDDEHEEDLDDDTEVDLELPLGSGPELEGPVDGEGDEGELLSFLDEPWPRSDDEVEAELADLGLLDDLGDEERPALAGDDDLGPLQDDDAELALDDQPEGGVHGAGSDEEGVAMEEALDDLPCLPPLSADARGGEDTGFDDMLEDIQFELEPATPAARHPAVDSGVAERSPPT